jgi:hypothetical protein
VRASGYSPQNWYAVESGLFSDRPSVVVEESLWDEPRIIAARHWYVIDTETPAVEHHADAMQADMSAFDSYEVDAMHSKCSPFP